MLEFSSASALPCELGSVGKGSLTSVMGYHKERRPSSITPRKFTKFFAPRTGRSIDSAKILDDVTMATNKYHESQPSPSCQSENPTVHEDCLQRPGWELKRRKLFHTPGNASEQPVFENSFPIHHLSTIDKEGLQECDTHILPRTGNGHEELDNSTQEKLFRGVNHRIHQLEDKGLAGKLLRLSLGYNAKSRRRDFIYPVSDWQDQTAGFYSGPDDVHLCSGVGSGARSIPFCTASCNTNTLVSIGDEDGYVRLIESSKNSKPKFEDIFLAFRPHMNAIIDLCFSSDDLFLATASGDQTAKVIDMTTQTTISVLAKHSASLKQVRFQPGIMNNIIATSSRDGTVKIWDLRCKGAEPASGINIQSVDSENTQLCSSRNKPSYGRAVGSIYNAHHSLHCLRTSRTIPSRSGPMREERSRRSGDISVTAISFLPGGQEHLLLTGSEANASVKLWDIRSLCNSRRKTTIPLSCTAQPKSHSQWRHFGINSLNLNSDGSRLYTLCKDNTVYVYSVPHLMLGQAPELSTAPAWARRQNVDCQEGLGPLYGYRHQQLHATSFYVKSAIRPAKFGRVEMLAVGSCEGCTILFPTDEKYLYLDSKPTLERNEEITKASQKGGNVYSYSRIQDNITISHNGTPLIRGHDKEVGALAWTSDGELITVGDDFLVRCWREGMEARELRIGGEQCGRRWNCGWADIPLSYDRVQN